MSDNVPSNAGSSSADETLEPVQVGEYIYNKKPLCWVPKEKDELRTPIDFTCFVLNHLLQSRSNQLRRFMAGKTVSNIN